MIITYHGKQYFKIQAGDTVLAVNPISNEAKGKGKPSKFGADVAMLTMHHPDVNGVENVTYGDKEPFLIDGPGSYEILGNYVQGLQSPVTIGSEKFINTLYYFTFDGIKVLFLGMQNSKEIPSQALEAIEEVDIVFVPVSSEFLMPAEAHKLALSFSPKLMIPMSYDDTSAKQFAKEAGADGKAVDKLTLKPKDLSGKEGDVVIIKA